MVNGTLTKYQDRFKLRDKRMLLMLKSNPHLIGGFGAQFESFELIEVLLKRPAASLCGGVKDVQFIR